MAEKRYAIDFKTENLQNQRPHFDPDRISPVHAFACEDVEISVHAVDPENHAIHYSVPIAPQGMWIDDDGTIHWHPKANETGVSSVAVVADDGDGGFAVLKFDLQVDLKPAENLEPIIVSYPDVLTIRQGQ